MSGQERIDRYAEAVENAVLPARVRQVMAVADSELAEERALVDRLIWLGSHADGHRCTCTLVNPGVYFGSNMHPPEWEQDPWCPTHPDVDYLRQQYEAIKAENAMLRACRDTEQRALAAALPIVAAATEGPRLWAEPDGFGEPTIWHEIAGAPQPVLAKSDLCVGARHLWPVVVARITAGSAS